jgi:pyrimidine operon attenuation protein/uracil phosphoribosyltransferase
MTNRVLLSEKKLKIILNRLCCQLIEKHLDFSRTVLIGIQPRGIYLLNRIVALLKNDFNITSLKSGILDITFFRDDFRRGDKPLNASTSEINIPIEGKSIVLVDDVLYTGRSIRAALTAIDSYGRPDSIELLVLIDRRFSRHLPIQPDYLGAQIDSVEGDRVKVSWKETDGIEIVYLEKNL